MRQAPGIAWQPLRAWSGAQQAEAAAALAPAWRSWQQAWLPRGASPDGATCFDACEAAPSGWELLGRDVERCAWIRLDTPALAEKLFAGSVAGMPSALALAAAHRARAALRTALAGAAGLASSDEELPPPADVFLKWRGATVVHLQGDLPCDVLLDAECMAGLAGARAPVTRTAGREPVTGVAHALGECTLTLRVEISQCDLSLGELVGLRLGDVVALPQQLADPVRVLAAGAPVFAGWLGRVGAAKAIELLPAAPSRNDQYQEEK
jgi:flagellar motor switch/type III secretory pathway protein FliN